MRAIVATFLVVLSSVAPAKPEKPESRHHKAHRLCDNDRPKWCIENAIIHGRRWMNPWHRYWMRATPACESTMNPLASNAGNLGLYQFQRPTWLELPLRYSRFSPFNAKRASLAAAFVLRRGETWRWPNCP